MDFEIGQTSNPPKQKVNVNNVVEQKKEEPKTYKTAAEDYKAEPAEKKENQNAQPKEPTPEAPKQQNPYYPPQQPIYAPMPPVPPRTTKPRSAYAAGLLHLFLGMLGFGYSYRGMEDKARNCWIMLLVGVLTSFIFVGVILLAVVQIINIVEAIKCFAGKVTVDAYGREMLQEF